MSLRLSHARLSIIKPLYDEAANGPPGARLDIETFWERARPYVVAHADGKALIDFPLAHGSEDRSRVSKGMRRHGTGSL